MSILPGGAHVITTRREHNGKVYVQHLVRRSYREGGKVKNETLANITRLGDEAVELLRAHLRGRAVGVVDEQFEVVQSWHHGHVQVVLAAMRRLGVAELLAPRPSTQRTLALAMIAARVLRPQSKLATADWLADTTLPHELGFGALTDDALYDALDWLGKQQPRVEQRLAARHLRQGGLVLYDLSSTYLEGRCCGLAALGHNRDRKHGKSQVNFGLVTDGEGRPVAVSVLRGNVGDPKTVMPQVEKVTQRFGIGEFVLVGDRGMVTQRQIDALRRDHPGVQWITALRSEGVRKLVESGRLQMGLFDERNLFELEHPDFPGERLVACRNPELAERRRHKRTELLAATEVLLAKLQARVAAGRLKGRDRIGLAAGRFVNKYKVAKHFALDIGEALFTWSRQYGAIDAEAALDGLYVVRTSVPAHRLDGDDAVRDYKRLCGVERAFRSMKSVDLHVRPVYHWHEHRVEAHIFLCMLAFYVQWHLQQALEKTTFADEFPDREGRDPVAKAAPSPEARRKAATKRDAAGAPVTGLHRVLQRMETVVRNRCRWTARPTAGTFDLVTTPDERQRKVLDLVEAITV